MQVSFDDVNKDVINGTVRNYIGRLLRRTVSNSETLYRKKNDFELKFEGKDIFVRTGNFSREFNFSLDTQTNVTGGSYHRAIFHIKTTNLAFILELDTDLDVGIKQVCDFLVNIEESCKWMVV